MGHKAGPHRPGISLSLAQTLPGCVPLGKSHTLSEPQLPPLKLGSTTPTPGLLTRFSDIPFVHKQLNKLGDRVIHCPNQGYFQSKRGCYS